MSDQKTSEQRKEDEIAEEAGEYLADIAAEKVAQLVGMGNSQEKKCKCANCTCVHCKCAEAHCENTSCTCEDCPTGGKKNSKCKNESCTCENCQCAEGTCTCGK
mmetsp:Transcript_58541/g.115118  ORF Transcript_58541/g.115118 Transcript_58541/m.115118 type:complete len:104 (-) Transcript_58541:130-441(-)